MPRFFLLLLLAAAPAFLARAPAAQTLSIPPSKDNTLYEEPAGLLSNALGPVMFAGRVGPNGGGVIRRAVLAFSLFLPVGTKVNSASLTLTVDKVATADPRDLDLHLLTADWGEGTSSTVGGIGSFVTPNDASWIHTFYPSGLWANPGGDFVAQPSATTTVRDVGAYVWSSAQLAADVQGWLDAPATNHGWIVIGDESVIETAKRITTGEGSTVAWPKLTVQFTFCPAALKMSRNGGSNPSSYAAGTMKLGTTFAATVDNNLAAQLDSLLFAFDTPSSVTLGGGQTLLCMDLGSGELLTGAGLAPTSSAGGIDSYSLALPTQAAFCGLTLYTQAIQFGTPPFTLSNAQDLTVGS